MHNTRSEFRRLLIEALEHYGGTKGQLARAIGITPSSLSHLMSSDGHRHQPGTDLCLRIARCCGLVPGRVLRAAGRAHIADLLDELYGPARAPVTPTARRFGLSPAEETIIDELRTLDQRTHRAFVLTIKAAASNGSGAAGAGPSGIVARRKDA